MSQAHRTVLFVCTGNAGRSQIAAALFSRLAGAGVTVLSGGVEPWDELHPVAAQLLVELGFDTTGLYPKHVDSFASTDLDWVVTIGDRAQTEIPRLSVAATWVHWAIADPADADGTGQEEPVFRRTLAAIEARLPQLLEHMAGVVQARDLHFAPGISTCIVRPNRFEPATHLPMIAAAGFSCIELNCYLGTDDFQWDRATHVRELRRVADDTGVSVYAVHAEGGLGGYRGPRSEQLAIDSHRAYADLATELGAPVVTMHAGLSGEDQTSSDELAASLDGLAHHVLDMPCRFAWENAALGLPPAAHLEWIRRLHPGSFGFVLDTGHSHRAGTTDAHLDACAGLLCDLHINDNNGTADEHRLPGSGGIRWHGFIDKLERADYVGPLMLEVLATERQDVLPRVLADARASLEFIKRPGSGT